MVTTLTSVFIPIFIFAFKWPRGSPNANSPSMARPIGIKHGRRLRFPASAPSRLILNYALRASLGWRFAQTWRRV